ncbi:MAG: hypothetical protein AVDCRST_MAG56-3385, partial [uncultured Cytophagales bacterium]
DNHCGISRGKRGAQISRHQRISLVSIFSKESADGLHRLALLPHPRQTLGPVML